MYLNEKKKKVSIWDGNVRDAALSILLAVDKNQAYCNLLLNQTINKYQIEAKDRGLVNRINIWNSCNINMTLGLLFGAVYSWKSGYYGFDGCYDVGLSNASIYQKFLNMPLSMKLWKLRKRRGHKGIASMVNGILRSILREGDSVQQIIIEDPIERIAIETSHPQWIVESLVESYGYEKTGEMLKENNIPPKQTVRVNTLKATVEQVITTLEVKM